MPLSDDANPDVLDTLITIHKKLHSTISTNILTASSIVYIKNQCRISRMGSKMEPRWIGPYLVVESLTKGRVKRKNNKTDKILRNTYHASNLRTYQDEEASPPTQSPDDSPSNSANDSPKQKTLKRPREEPDNDDIYISQKHKQTYKAKGDGNCYFRAISYILTGSEDNHSLLKDKVVHHMNTDVTKNRQDYLNQNVNEYVNTSGISHDGVWATDGEIMATANLLSCDILIHTKVVDSMDWMKLQSAVINGTCTLS